tara:strand:- start:27 stop:278 length:252 start_codon:yes stop_codon:yes gene_type:complete
LHKDIARARLLNGDLQRAEAKLDQWQQALDIPSAALIALQENLAFAKDHYKSDTARERWMKSYAHYASVIVERKLIDPKLWSD